MLELERICVCCLGSSGLKSLLESPRKGKNVSISYLTMLEICCVLTIEKLDGMPKQICGKCLLELKTAYKFRRKCDKSYAHLIDKLKTIDNNDSDSLIFNVGQELTALPVKNEDCFNDSGSDTRQQMDDTQDDDIIFEKFKEEIKVEAKFENEQDVDSTFIYELVSNTDIIAEESNFDSLTDLPQLSSRERRKVRKKKVELDESLMRSAKLSAEDLNSLIAGTQKTVCPLCKKRMYTVSKLRDHINFVHFGVKSYYCAICKKHYMSEERHRQKHTSPKAFSRTCQFCEEVFQSKPTYFEHMRAHGKGHICECGLSFQNTSSLYRHRQKHKGKKMMCHLCSKSFLRHDNLKEHIRRHNKDTPYACDKCPKKFVSSYDLKQHTERHAKVKNYPCNDCKLTFRTKKDLYQHTWRHHTGEKRYACKVCNKAFRRSDHRNIHQRTVHSLDEKKLPETNKKSS